ncbi:MAG: hypothetical protein JJE51_03005 [Thermoanaerobaculia bacterium]|nr:hypothetical protein [Thermoanaerobaculia bacterium]
MAFVPASFAQLPPSFVGVVDRPDPNVEQTGVIGVKGWAYDPLSISKIELYVDDQFQHPVVKELPYLDIVEAYPNWPGLHTAKVGFQTGFLASRFSNGPHSVHVRVTTQDGRIEEIGRRTITINNLANQAPFGSLDQPDAKGVYNTSGSFPMVGWVADSDGVARVEVQVDDGTVQSAMYGDSRPDVGAAFPDFPAALFSGFIANVDTTRIQDGVHFLTVTAVDLNGMSRLIGRRVVQILNSENNLKPFGHLDEPLRDSVLFGTLCGVTSPIFSPPVRPTAHITPVRGWALDLGTRLNPGRVSYVELLVDGVRWLSTDDCNIPFGAYANCYGLPRYDVQRFYPNYPDAPRAGFLFTLDVGQLIAAGYVREGNHVLKVRVGDQQQTFAELPNAAGIPVFFKCAETTADSASVGFIDIPTSFDYVTGDVLFQGWALDREQVAAVEIIVDGNYVGQAQTGFSRLDVREQWPQFPTAAFSGWRFLMDTTRLSNSRHRVTARVLDANGHRNEIGSKDFYVYNLAKTP